ncbi:unnamed protein product [Sphenostylis stenocarpa]|uniref:Homeobox domain-containing protein n=1 Tax=Sphenostylis stenocarpa TaxID=92480 RepID=A0AA86RYT5_9FABA|nr:unnamed protein product [Sphenostylis stenocarpa]
MEAATERKMRVRAARLNGSGAGSNDGKGVKLRIFKECSHPDETRRRQIGEELGLDAKQVKFWFQNKKTQLRTKSERLDINALRLENERIQSENRIMSETLKTVACAPCGGRAMGPEERELYLQILKVENILLIKEVSEQYI